MTQPGQQANAPVDTLTSVPPPAPIQVGSNGQAGGYKFSADEVGAVITQWKNLLDDLKTDVNNARVVADVSAPGKEFASADFINAATPSGATLLTQHDRMVTYVENYITALQTANGQTQQAEDDAQQAIAKQGKGVV
jgi:membrane-bound ClpP family serine protease